MKPARINQRSYEDEAKQRWHRTALMDSADRMMTTPVSERRVLYLDTREALQTIALLERGYRADNLLAANFLPVELALLTRRLDELGLPRVNTRAGDFVDVAHGIGKVHWVDFDGMSNLGGAVGDILLLNAACATTPECLSFAILCGRETGEAREKVQIASKLAHSPFHTSSGKTGRNHSRHFARLQLVAWNATGYRHQDDPPTCVHHIKDFRWGSYVSTAHQPMAWMALKLISHKSDKDRRGKISYDSATRVIRYMMTPICLNCDFTGEEWAAYGGCPSWSPQQASDQGADLERLRSAYPKATPYSGWPKRKTA